jgi:hypothetical protein
MFLFLVSLSGNRQESPSTLYFIRSTGVSASAYSFSTFVNDSLFCKLNNKRFSIHAVWPGLKSIHAQYGGSKPKEKPDRISLLVEPGRIYYVKLSLEQGFGGCELFCSEISPMDARNLLKQLKADSKCK